MKRMIQFPDPAARELPPETRAEPQRVKRKHKGKKKLKQKRNHHHELQSLFQAFFAPNKLLAARSLADRLNALVAQRWPGSQVDVFGSCASGLAGPDSDVDLVAHGHGDLARGDPSAIVKVHHFLEDCELGLCEFRRVLNARVPLLKFKRVLHPKYLSDGAILFGGAPGQGSASRVKFALTLS